MNGDDGSFPTERIKEKKDIYKSWKNTFCFYKNCNFIYLIKSE